MSSSGEQVVFVLAEVSKATFLGITWASTWVSFAFLVFRLVVRWRTFGNIQLDDFFVIAAWLMLLAAAIVWQYKIYFVYELNKVLQGQSPTASFFSDYASFMPQIVTWNILFYTCLWSIKISFLIFFRRLGSKAKAHIYWWWTVLGLVLIGWVGCIADIDWGCSLKSITYIATVCAKPDRVRFDNNTFYANMAVDVVTDLLVISIPVVIIRKVQIQWRKKAALLAVFSATLLIMIISVVRVTLVRGSTTQLQSGGLDRLYLWSNVECGIAIIVASVGSFRQLFVSTKSAHLPLHGKASNTPRSWLFRDLLSRFTRLGSKSRSADASQEHLDGATWQQTTETKGSSDSQTHIMPLQSVHIKTTYDINRGPRVLGPQVYSHTAEAFAPR